MFRRAILRQIRQFSSRQFTAPGSTSLSASLSSSKTAANQFTLSNVAHQQRFPPALLRLERAYSGAASQEPPIPEKKAEDGVEKMEEPKKEDAKEPAPAAKEPLAKEEEELVDIAKQLEQVQKELDERTKEARDYKDKFTRAVADYRNFQDRVERDKRAARDFAIQKFAKDLVDSVDNLDRALKAVPEESRSDAEKNKELVDLYNGLKMTEEILLGTMKKHGLEKLDPLGEPFDPNKHEATFLAPMPDKEPSTVFHVQQTGYILNGRTIRAAKVGVVATPKS